MSPAVNSNSAVVALATFHPLSSAVSQRCCCECATISSSLFIVVAASFLAGFVSATVLPRAVQGVRWCLQQGIALCDRLQGRRLRQRAAPTGVLRKQPATGGAIQNNVVASPLTELSTRELYLLYQESLRRKG